jgi:hypothetical protein
MVRRRSTVRFRKGAPGQRPVSNVEAGPLLLWGAIGGQFRGIPRICPSSGEGPRFVSSGFHRSGRGSAPREGLGGTVGGQRRGQDRFGVALSFSFWTDRAATRLSVRRGFGCTSPGCLSAQASARSRSGTSHSRGCRSGRADRGPHAGPIGRSGARRVTPPPVVRGTAISPRAKKCFGQAAEEGDESEGSEGGAVEDRAKTSQPCGRKATTTRSAGAGPGSGTTH